VANLYRQFVGGLDIAFLTVLGRRGKALFSGEDDVFSSVAVSMGYGFGVFPQLRVTHLIAAGRLNQRYFLELIHGHAFSSSVMYYVLGRIQPRRIDWTRYAHMFLHGIRNGQFSMRCQWARSSGEDEAARYILANRLQPFPMAGSADFAEVQRPPHSAITSAASRLEDRAGESRAARAGRGWSQGGGPA
jgi:hypothetical protein